MKPLETNSNQVNLKRTLALKKLAAGSCIYATMKLKMYGNFLRLKMCIFFHDILLVQSWHKAR